MAVILTNKGPTGTYDAAGDMTCRATSGATTGAGTPTGAQLMYDAERRLTHWQDRQSSPPATDDYLYLSDGAGQRIQKQSVSGGTTTLTTYIGGGIAEAQAVNGNSTRDEHIRTTIGRHRGLYGPRSAWYHVGYVSHPYLQGMRLATCESAPIQ